MFGAIAIFRSREVRKWAAFNINQLSMSPYSASSSPVTACSSPSVDVLNLSTIEQDGEDANSCSSSSSCAMRQQPRVEEFYSCNDSSTSTRRRDMMESKRFDRDWDRMQRLLTAEEKLCELIKCQYNIRRTSVQLPHEWWYNNGDMNELDSSTNRNTSSFKMLDADDYSNHNSAKVLNITTIEVLPAVEDIIESKTGDTELEIPIVFVGGFAAGAALFYRNLDDLAKKSKRRVLAMDWLGCGTSDRRVPFPTRLTLRKKKMPSREEENKREMLAEMGLKYFIDVFEKWRIAENIEKFDLVGHSFGGFLAGHYAYQYSRQTHVIRKLILTSSWGVPMRLDVPKGNKTPAISSQGPDPRVSGVKSKSRSCQSLWIPPICSATFAGLMKANISPLSFIRGTGSIGRSIFCSALHRRLGRFIKDDRELSLLSEYVCQINSVFSSSSIEQSFSTFMDPILDPSLAGLDELGFYSTKPLEHLLDELTDSEKFDIKLSFVYGERDWMWSDGARKAIEALSGRADLYFTPGGHLMYLEDSMAFDNVLLKILNK